MKVRQVIFIIGVLYLTFSQFFCIQIDEFSFIWLGVALLTLVFFVFVLVDEVSWKMKLKWIVIALAGALIFVFTRSFQFNTSCKMYIASNKADLDSIVAIVAPGESDYFLNSKSNDTSDYTAKDFAVRRYLRNADAYMVIKGKDLDSNKYVYVELWGFLDSRFGFTYYDKPITEDYYKPIRHVTGNWYR